MSNTYNFWDPVVTSPVYGLLETVGQLPGVRDTSFLDWLDSSPLFQGAQAFREQEPGWALAGDIASSFIPYIGWGAALNRAGQAANLGRGVLGLTNRLGVQASRAVGGGILGEAVGTTVMYTPPALAMTGFDLAGQRYDNGVDAATGLVLGTALGTGAQFLGRALTPAVGRLVGPSARDIAAGRYESRLAEAWRTVFEPPAQLAEMAGFSPNVQRAAVQASKHPSMQGALAPELEPQIMHRELIGIRDQLRAGTLQGIDPTLVDQQIDNAIRMNVAQSPERFESVFDLGPEPPDTQRTQELLDWSLRYGPEADNEGARIRRPLVGTAGHLDHPQTLGEALELPQDWIADVKWPGLVQVDHTRSNTYSRLMNLPERNGPEFTSSNAPIGQHMRRVTRTLPSGQTQVWTARREADTGLWFLATEVPGDHKMTSRGLYKGIKRRDPRDGAREFFTFKTDRPQRFIPDAFTDLDNARPDALWHRRVNLDTTKSALLKQILDYEDVYLNPQTVKGIQRSLYGSRAKREKLASTILAGPTGGQQIMNAVRHVAAPTVQQFKDDPVALGTWGLYRSIIDGLETRVRAQLHGKASIDPKKSPLGTVFALRPGVDDTGALVPELRRIVQEDPQQLELIRGYLKRNKTELKDLEGTPAGEWLKKLHKTADDLNLTEYNNMIKSLRAIGATDAKLIPFRGRHAGVSHNWDGSIFVPIYKAGDIRPTAAVAGGSKAAAEKKADEWLAAVAKEEPGTQYRKGEVFIPGGTDRPPGWLVKLAGDPRFLQPRAGMRGYEHEFTPYKHIDDFVAELENNFIRRARYAGRVAADALTINRRNQLRLNNPQTWQTLDTRLAQLLGQPTAIDEWQNRVLDSALAPFLGTNSASKLADAINETMFHSLYAGHIGTPTLNLTSMFQTHIPAALEMLTSDANALRGFGYWVPFFDATGKARPGMNFVTDPIGMWWGGIKRAMNPSDKDREVFEYVFNNKIIGGFMNEFTGQDRTIAARASEGIRGPEDMLYWFRRVSGLLMAKSTQFSRTAATGMALETMDRLEKAFGINFTAGQRVHNAINMIERADYNYFKQDRPLMFTSPLGSVFGNQKTWMVNYLWMLGHYFGLGKDQGNWAPLLFSLGSTAALGGAFAVPLLGQGIDLLASLDGDKDGKEWIFEHMGEGGNAISFGLPALFGLSLSENVAAPGANLAHDAEFLFSIVALEKAKQFGRTMGRALDNATILGQNPFHDELFRRQALQTFTPRAFYRTWEALQEGPLRSASTGYPMVRDFGLGARVLHGMGFRDVDIAIQYEAYRELIADKRNMSHTVSVMGEAYANASLNNDRETMTRILQQATIMGVSVDSIMRSAQIRMRNEGQDMFGRNFNEEQINRYRETLEAGGR